MKFKLKNFISTLLALTVVCGLFTVPTSVYAAYDSNEVVEYALSRVGKSYSSGYCLRFVKECFNHCYGFTSSACCAYTYSTKFKDSSSKTNIPIGADVFFKGVASKCSTCGNKAGHIGIYVGNGYVVHATGGKVQKSKLSSIEAWSGCSYVGWGWHGNKSFTSVPSTPKISSVSATADNEITVKWNSVSGAEKYILQGRKAGGDYQTIAEITGTSYTHKKLDSASLYWYHVKAKNSAGTSGYSDASAAYTKPSTPTTSIINTSSIKVSWSGSGGNTSYELLARKAGDADYTTIAQNINGYTYTHSGLEAGTQYYYKIKAHNNEHSSVVSARSDAGYGYTKLNSPWITRKTADTVSLDWSRGVLNGDYNYTYRIRRKTSYDADYTNIAVVSNSSYTDYNLQPNTTYRYYVDVLRNGSYCVHSETVDVTTNEQPATQIALSTAEATLTPGQTYQLYATVLPENTTNKSVTWTSSNYDAAEISNGNVTAKAVGTAVITAQTANGITASCSITVDTAENLCEHSFREWTETKAATCTENGEKTRSCEKCGKTEIEVIPATGHSYSEEWTTVTEPTCSEYGVKKHLCTICGTADEATAETIDMTEHTPSDEWIIDKEPTCSETGEQHRLCAVCGEKCDTAEIPTSSHQYDNEWIIEQTANCQQEGIESRTCYVCKEKEFRYREKTEHDYVLTDLKEATSSEEGYATYVCRYCNDSHTDIIPVVADEASIIVHSAKAKAGQNVDVEISIHNNPGIASAKIKINYDTSVLTLQKVTDAGMLGSTSHSPSLTSPYVLYWNNGAATENFTYNGTIATLTFKVNDNAAKGEYPISVDFTEEDIFNVDMDVVKLDSNNGEIDINDVLLGDLNSDGNITVKDNMILSRYIAGWPEYTSDTVNVDAADVFPDGKINVKDDMVLARYIASWPGYETLPFNQ